MSHRGFNVPGVPSSGFKPISPKLKLQGSHSCVCGRTISANKTKCAACPEPVTHIIGNPALVEESVNAA